MRWPVEEVRGAAAELHGRLPTPDRRLVRVVRVAGPALVLGSSQSEAVVDRAAVEDRGGSVVRRRSGGGAVWLEPQDPLWVDVVVPAGDPLHHDDVGRAFLWLGATWAAALADLGAAGVVHRGPADRTEHARLACFAGRGAGEVFIDGHKVVGLSQRRTRAGSVFQCAVHERFDPAALLSVLGRSPSDPLARSLPSRGTGVPHAELLPTFLRHLPTP